MAYCNLIIQGTVVTMMKHIKIGSIKEIENKYMDAINHEILKNTRIKFIDKVLFVSFAILPKDDFSYQKRFRLMKTALSLQHYIILTSVLRQYNPLGGISNLNLPSLILGV